MRWPLRPVLDTNVLVSSPLIPSGAVAWLRGACRQASLRPLGSRETAAERIRVLAYPGYARDSDDRRDLLDDYLPDCESIEVPVAPPAIPECRDPLGRPFLQVALAGRADAIVAPARQLPTTRWRFVARGLVPEDVVLHPARQSSEEPVPGFRA